MNQVEKINSGIAIRAIGNNAKVFYSPSLALASLPLKDPAKKLDPSKPNNVWHKNCGLVEIELHAGWEKHKRGKNKG